jgi:ribosomal protein S18 acetylase RimI-like enzyme
LPSDPPVTIRPIAGAEEADACARVMSSSEPWITLRRDYDHALHTLTNPTREVLVALVEDILSGFIVINMGGPFAGYIQTVFVFAECRHRGVGRALIKFAEKRIFRETPNVFLCVSSFNTDAQRFYEQLGYKRVGEIADYVVDGHSELLMRKTLGPIGDYPAPGRRKSKAA